MEGQRMDFGFGFNDTVFSDRVLRIEVIADSLDSEVDCVSNWKRRGKDLDKENVVEVKTLHVNSLLLAASSPFFYKLFKNGMKESQQRDVTMKITASEDAALMDILKFIYTNTLSSALPDLVGVLIVADKFEVTSCMKYCSELLKESPMSLESALLYLELPASVSLGELVQPLIAAAKKYLVARYSDFHKSKNEVMDLPLCAVEVVLSGVGLQVSSEDDVFGFILEWARKHYPKLIERREILSKRLVKCLCFPLMSCSELKKVLACPDFGHEEVSKLVFEALFLKVEAPYLQYIYASKDLATTNFNSLGRIYMYRPIRVVQLEFPQPRCIVHFYLRKEECENLFKAGWIYSELFDLGGRQFFLMAKCCTDEQPGTFGLFLYMIKKESGSCTLEYEYSVIKKSTKEFESMVKDTANFDCSYEGHWGWGSDDLLGIPWTEFAREDSEYFIDGILHLRAELTINA